MMHEEYKNDGVNYVRIDKKKARIKYNSGKEIVLVQDRMRLDNAWQRPFSIYIHEEERSEKDFDKLVNAFLYYICDSERGRGVKYFIKEVDL